MAGVGGGGGGWGPFQVLVKHLGLAKEGTLKFQNFAQKSLVCDKQVFHCWQYISAWEHECTKI